MVEAVAVLVLVGLALWGGLRFLNAWTRTKLAVYSDRSIFFRVRTEAGASRDLERLFIRRRGHLTLQYPARWAGNFIQTRHASNGLGWDMEWHVCAESAIIDHSGCSQWSLHTDSREHPVDEDFVRSMMGHYLGGYYPPAPYFKDISYVLTSTGTDDDDLAPPDAEPAGGFA